MQLEVCASTPVDVAIALEAGANRVELCAHWECGGLTLSSNDKVKCSLRHASMGPSKA